MSITLALKALERARADHDAAVGAQSKAFKANDGHECPNAEQISEAACDRVMAAERDLVATKPQNPVEALRKIAALLDGGILDETVAAIKSDALRFASGSADPLVPLEARAADMHRMIEGQQVTGALYGDMMDKLHELEARAVNLVPSTPQGLSAAIDLYWRTEGPCCPMGTACWHEQMRSPALRMLANIRTGAQQLAGREAD